MAKRKIVRITTVPISLQILLGGQLKYMQEFFDVVGVSSPGTDLNQLIIKEGIRIKEVKMTRSMSPFRDMISLLKLTFYFLRENPQIVHTHTPKAGIIGMLAAWLSLVPVRLHTVAGLPLLETKGVKRLLLDTVEKITSACAISVYPNSLGLKDIIIKNGYCKTTKLQVIGNGSSNGIDTKHFSIEAISVDTQIKIKSEHQIGNEDFVFIFVGRLVKDKGIQELIAAFVTFNETNPQAKLLLVGNEEPELDPLDEQTRTTMQNHPAIRLTGYQSDVRPFLAVAQALVFPSYREGFPNVVMQAGAMDLPAIVTNINGCNEIIINEHNGLIIPPKNTQAIIKAMERLVKDKNLYLHIKAKTRESIVSRYDQLRLWKLIKQEYDNHLSRTHNI